MSEIINELLESLNKKNTRIYACEKNIMLFSMYYFSHYQNYLIPDFHFKMYQDLNYENGITGLMWRMFRESAKTAIAKIKVIHNIVYEKSKFQLWTSFDKAKATANCFDIAVELQTNKRLKNDFGQLFFDNSFKQEERKSTKKSVGEFITTNGIKVLASSTGQDPRGHNFAQYRPDFLIFDDIENLKTVESEAATEEIIDYFDTAITGAAGYAKRLILCNYVSDCAAIAYIEAKIKNDPHWQIRDFGVLDKTGNPVWIDKYVLTDNEAEKINSTITNEFQKKVSLETKKREFGEQVFNREMLNIPISEDEREFKEKWIQKISWDKVRQQETINIALIDTAYSQAKTACRTGICKNYYNPNSKKWHIDAKGIKINSKELLDYIFQLHDEGFKIIGVEETAFYAAIEPFFNAELKLRQKFFQVVPLKPLARDKVLRIRGLIIPYSNFQIFHIENECADLEFEMKAFRGQKKTLRDVLDATAYMNDIVKDLRSEIKQTNSNRVSPLQSVMTVNW